MRPSSTVLGGLLALLVGVGGLAAAARPDPDLRGGELRVPVILGDGSGVEAVHLRAEEAGGGKLRLVALWPNGTSTILGAEPGAP